MKKIAIVLLSTFISMNAFSMNAEEYIELKKEDIVKNSQNDTLTINKCKLSSIANGALNDYVCSFSSYSLGNIENGKTFNYENSQITQYESSIAKNYYMDNEDKKKMTDTIIELENHNSFVILTAQYLNNTLNVDYSEDTLLALKEFKTDDNTTIYAPETSSFKLNSNMIENSFHIINNQNEIIFFYWKTK
jgi:hypothetical protein